VKIKKEAEGTERQGRRKALKRMANAALGLTGIVLLSSVPKTSASTKPPTKDYTEHKSYKEYVEYKKYKDYKDYEKYASLVPYNNAPIFPE
jgi:hypothetical protein